MATWNLFPKNDFRSAAGVRLVDGKGLAHQGRVEVFYNGTWGTVCHSHWDLKDGKVVCRQLGFEGAIRMAYYSEFGRGNGVIWMYLVNCRGHESSLQRCYHHGWGQTSTCSHYSDAGVVCIPGNYEMVTSKSRLESFRYRLFVTLLNNQAIWLIYLWNFGLIMTILGLREFKLPRIHPQGHITLLGN